MTAGPVTPRTTEERTHFYCTGKERFRSIMSRKETGGEFLARFRGRGVGSRVLVGKRQHPTEER